MDTLTRRKFLLASGVVGAAAIAAGGTAIALDDLTRAAQHAPLQPGEGVLVLITLYGGNDGLNTVVPAADPAYQKARPDLAYQPEEVLDLGDGLGLNPAMTAMHGLWNAGRLAVVRGVGYPDPDHSHFVSMDIWQTASPRDPAESGWLGRWLDLQPDDGLRALRAVSLGAVLPPLLAGTRTAGSSLPLGPLRLPGGAQGATLRALGDPSAQDCPEAAYAASDTADVFTVAGALGPALNRAASAASAASPTGSSLAPSAVSAASGTPSVPAAARKSSATRASGSASPSSLAGQLDIVASCIESAAPTRVYAVSLGGFDTHAGEKGTQGTLLGELSDAIGAFEQRMSATSRAGDVVVLVYSEFGRRVAANANDGTDHGTAAPVFLAGSAVRGGFTGAQPSLTDLDEGDLKAGIDFRSVYATVLERVLDTDPAAVLGGSFPTLPIL